VVSGSKNYSAQTNVYTSCIAPGLDQNRLCTYLSWVLFYFLVPDTYSSPVYSWLYDLFIIYRTSS